MLCPTFPWINVDFPVFLCSDRRSGVGDVVKMAEVKFSARAYCKMMLHAAKYPHCAINGVLLAEEQKCKEEKKGRGLFICDAIPLFHHCLHVTPMAEIALTQVRNYVLLLMYCSYMVCNLLYSKRCSNVDKSLLNVVVVIVKYSGHILKKLKVTVLCIGC
jgi:Uncharacterised protein family (UPF0172).